MNDIEIDALIAVMRKFAVESKGFTMSGVVFGQAATVIADLRNEVVRLRAGLEEAKHANDDADLFDIVERVLNG
jgi:hypothetical protein